MLIADASYAFVHGLLQPPSSSATSATSGAQKRARNEGPPRLRPLF